MNSLVKSLLLVALFITLNCRDKMDLAESSFGPQSQEGSKASAASVISMGRDDDDGKAKKWHIGGSD